MTRTARTAAPLLLSAVLATALLAGCSSGTLPEPQPASGETATPSEGSTGQGACIVGDWALDVAAYRVTTEEYLLGLGLPIEGYDLTGVGVITFTADGLVATDVDLTSSGTIVAGDVRVPVNSPGRYTATGDWSTGDGDTINLANWSDDINVNPDPLADPSGPGVPVDFTDIPNIASTCSANELVLSAPGAPFDTIWWR